MLGVLIFALISLALWIVCHFLHVQYEQKHNSIVGLLSEIMFMVALVITILSMAVSGVIIWRNINSDRLAVRLKVTRAALICEYKEYDILDRAPALTKIDRFNDSILMSREVQENKLLNGLFPSYYLDVEPIRAEELDDEYSR